MSETTTKEPVDLRERFPRPPFAQLKMAAPGNEAKMHPHPDHGEDSYTGNGKLSGRAALITGGDSGIGRAIALCYAKEGADVLFTCLPEERKDADETVRLVEATGRRAVALPGDIRQKAFCQHLVEQTLHHFGRLDILVNNAAFQRACDKLEDFVAASGLNTNDSLAKASGAGVKHFLTKPYTAETLLTTIRQILEWSGQKFSPQMTAVGWRRAALMISPRKRGHV